MKWVVKPTQEMEILLDESSGGEDESDSSSVLVKGGELNYIVGNEKNAGYKRNKNQMKTHTRFPNSYRTMIPNNELNVRSGSVNLNDAEDQNQRQFKMPPA